MTEAFTLPEDLGRPAARRRARPDLRRRLPTCPASPRRPTGCARRVRTPPGIPGLAVPAGEPGRSSKARVDASPDRRRTADPGTLAARPAPRARLRPPLAADGGIDIDGKSYPVTHRFGAVPVHLLGWRVDLDHQTPQVTARAPQAMVQELLNRSDDTCGRSCPTARCCGCCATPPPGRPGLRRVRPGSHLRRRALHRLRAAVPALPRVAVRPRGDAARRRATWTVARVAADQGQRALAQLARGVEQAISDTSAPGSSPTPTTSTCGTARPAHGDSAARGLPPVPAAPGVPAAVLVRRRGPRRAAQPRPEDPDAKRRSGCAGTAALRDLLLLRPAAPARPHTAAATGTATYTKPSRSCSTPSAAKAASRSSPCPASAASSRPNCRGRPLPGRAAGRRPLSNEALLSAVRALAIVDVTRGGALPPGRLRQPRRRGTRQRLRRSCWSMIPRYDDDDPRVHARPSLPGNERKETGSYYTPTRWSTACSTPPWTRCWTRRAQSQYQPNESRRCSSSPSATPPAAPATSSSPPPAASPSGSPPRRPANPSRPAAVIRTRCGGSSAAASTAWTSTRWPPSWPRCRCGWKHWSPASRCPSSTRTSASATPCSASPPPCWPRPARRRLQAASKATTARSSQP